MGSSVKIEKSHLYGEIGAPPSKSYTHRPIIIAALGRGKSTIKNPLISRDTQASILLAQSLGAQVERKGENLEIIGNGWQGFLDNKIYAGNSGTTLRIATALAALDKKEIELFGDSSLNTRPLSYLTNALISKGAQITVSVSKKINEKKVVIDEVPPIFVKGPIQGGDIRVNGSMSSQYISGLMIAAPIAKLGLNIEIAGNAVSKPYMDITMTCMEHFGIKFEQKIAYKNYSIAPQEYKPANFEVPSDYSAIALLISAGILAGKGIVINAKSEQLPQGDKAILGIVKELGAKVSVKEGKIEVEPIEKLHGGNFDLSNTPDLVIPVGILALKAGHISIFNVAHARRKETDRLDALAQELRKLGMNTTQTYDGITISKLNGLHGARLDSRNDHRMFMGLAIAGMYVGDTTVSNAESIDVSHPRFIEDMKKIGAQIRRIE